MEVVKPQSATNKDTRMVKPDDRQVVSMEANIYADKPIQVGT